MFTGIIESKAKVIRTTENAGKMSVLIERPLIFTDIKIGSSIACNGICLTVNTFDTASFSVEVMAETLKKSNASLWHTGSVLNLERALQLGDRLDGHWVQGHVDQMTPVSEVRTKASTTYISFSYPSSDAAMLVPQGSIAVNGVSLTIAELLPHRFSVALISHTLTNSNLFLLKPGDQVNIEYDIAGKYLLRMHQKGNINEAWLAKQGF